MSLERGLGTPERPHDETDRSGYDLLNAPLLNKGLGFTDPGRELLKFHRLLPPSVATLDGQAMIRRHLISSEERPSAPAAVDLV